MLSLKKILTKILEQLGQSFAFNRLGEAIPSGADLNSYTTPGLARSTSGAISTSLSNTPYTGGGFLLITIYSVSTGGQIQVLIPAYLTAASGVYIRTHRISSWDAWLKIALAEVS